MSPTPFCCSRVALFSVTVLVFLLLQSSVLFAADGLALMAKVDEAMSSSGEELAVQMTLKSASGSTEQRAFRMWMAVEPGQGTRSLIRFQRPASIAGTALLSQRRTDGGQDNWLYVPALSQVRRVAPTDRKQPFVQSEFTIEDLTVARDPERRVYSLLGEVQWNDRSCLQLEDRPKDADAARLSGYSRVVLYIDKEHHVVHRVDFYDPAGSLLKVLRAQKLVQVAGKWRFDVAVMSNLQTGASTVMQVTSRTLRELDPSIFSPSRLDSW